MKYLVDCEQMKAIDAYTIREMEIPSSVLMERAALSVVEVIEKNISSKDKILVVCGSGNNGGDGIAVARILHLHGFCADVFLAGKKEKMTQETMLQYKIAKNYGITFVHTIQWSEYTVIVDAIFGVGLKREIQGVYREWIEKMNQVEALKIAVDLPSGIHGDNGSVLGVAFQADVTVTFAYRKRGLCFYPGRMYAGKIITADIGIYSESDSLVKCLEKEDLAWIQKRVPYGNKGTFGKVLLVAGSEGMCGAAFFAASAALAAGCGMVKVITAKENRIPLQTLLPEAMISCDFSEEENAKNLNWCDTLVIGPGIGTSKEAVEHAEWFLSHAKEAEKPVILDADGLNLLSMNPHWRQILPMKLVLTPHLGEMSRLNGKPIKEIQENLIETAVACAKEFQAVCVLKDACTVTADFHGTIFMNLSGNAGMATAGSGDVLAGILGAICCMPQAENQKAQSFETVQYIFCQRMALGVFLHGRSGDYAAAEKGMHSMKARDIMEHIKDALRGKEDEI